MAARQRNRFVHDEHARIASECLFNHFVPSVLCHWFCVQNFFPFAGIFLIFHFIGQFHELFGRYKSGINGSWIFGFDQLDSFFLTFFFIFLRFCFFLFGLLNVASVLRSSIFPRCGSVKLKSRLGKSQQSFKLLYLRRVISSKLETPNHLSRFPSDEFIRLNLVNAVVTNTVSRSVLRMYGSFERPNNADGQAFLPIFCSGAFSSLTDWGIATH